MLELGRIRVGFSERNLQFFSKRELYPDPRCSSVLIAKRSWRKVADSGAVSRREIFGDIWKH
jgi:hypothetical protein